MFFIGGHYCFPVVYVIYVSRTNSIDPLGFMFISYQSSAQNGFQRLLTCWPPSIRCSNTGRKKKKGNLATYLTSRAKASRARGGVGRSFFLFWVSIKNKSSRVSHHFYDTEQGSRSVSLLPADAVRPSERPIHFLCPCKTEVTRTKTV